MKTKDLIKYLQEEDPTGEEECCVDGVDILFVEKLPGGYDGCYEVLIRDPAKSPFYNVIGAEFRKKSWKIQIHTHSIRYMLYDSPELPVTSDYKMDENMLNYIEELRKNGREVHENRGK